MWWCIDDFGLLRLLIKFNSKNFRVKVLKNAVMANNFVKYFRKCTTVLYEKTSLEHIKVGKIVLFYLFTTHWVSNPQSQYISLKYSFKSFSIKKTKKINFSTNLHRKTDGLSKKKKKKKVVTIFFSNGLISNILHYNCGKFHRNWSNISKDVEYISKDY